MYDELISRLLSLSEIDAIQQEPGICRITMECIGAIKEIAIEAADAIEELQKLTDAQLDIIKQYQAYLNKSRWIPVTDRLPEERMAVIVYAPYMKNEFMAYWTGSRWMVWAAGEYEREMPEYHQITHWMPLPEPPKEET